MKFIEMNGRTLMRMLEPDEVSPDELQRVGLTDTCLVRINQQGDIEVRRSDRWDVIGGLLGLWIAVQLAIALWRQLGFWFQVGVLLVGGLLSLGTLVLPILGAVATLVGIALVVSRLRQPRMASA